MMREKFDGRICENCAWFWTGNNVPVCHFKGKHIYEGECIEYRPKEKEEDEYESMVREYEEYQDEWN